MPLLYRLTQDMATHYSTSIHLFIHLTSITKGLLCARHCARKSEPSRVPALVTPVPMEGTMSNGEEGVLRAGISEEVTVKVK